MTTLPAIPADPASIPNRSAATLSRRRFLASLAGVSAIALLAGGRPKQGEALVEVNGWILKRSDLA